MFIEKVQIVPPSMLIMSFVIEIYRERRKHCFSWKYFSLGIFVIINLT